MVLASSRDGLSFILKASEIVGVYGLITFTVWSSMVSLVRSCANTKEAIKMKNAVILYLIFI
jgi:hypothetical protein